MYIFFLVGRVIFGGYFMYNGYSHFKNLANMTGYAQMKGVPLPKYAVMLSGTMLIIGGLYVVTGFLPIVGICLLLAFLVPVTYQMHQFWNITDPMQKLGEKINFTKNLALIGALLMMLSLTTPWIYSINF